MNLRDRKTAKTLAIYAGVIFVSLGIGAAMAGGSSSSTAADPSSTVTVTEPAAPAETTTETVEKTPEVCRQAMLKQNDALAALLAGSRGYAALVAPSYKAGVLGTSVDGITAKMRVATAKIRLSTKLERAATPLSVACLNGGQ